jgi:hypothetical protein
MDSPYLGELLVQCVCPNSKFSDAVRWGARRCCSCSWSPFSRPRHPCSLLLKSPAGVLPAL